MRTTIQEPGGRLLFVPVRSAGCGAITPRTGRLASGERIWLAFTSEAALVATLRRGSGGSTWPSRWCRHPGLRPRRGRRPRSRAGLSRCSARR